MTRLRRLLGAYLRRYLLQWLASRGFVLTLTVNQAVAPLLGLAVWSAALPGRQAISTYYVALLLVQLLTVSYEHHTFAGRIYNGELADALVLPRPVILEPLAENLALRAWHLLIGLPLLLSVSLVAHVQLGWANIALALPALALAAALRFLFTYTLALSGFWTARAFSVVGFGETLIFLLGGGAAPLALLPAPLRAWAAALPFLAMYAFPAELAAGSLDASSLLMGYAWQLCWLGLFLALATRTWRVGLRRYTAVGG